MNTVVSLIKHFHSDSLYRNSIYIMLSTAIMSFFGFFFWIINARIYTPDQIGIATTMISVSGLIASFSQLGYNSAIIRYLPNYKDKNLLINNVVIMLTSIAIIIATIYVINIHIFSPKLLFIRESLPLAIFVIFSFVIAALNNFSDSIFVAYRRSIFVLIYNTLQSVFKITLAMTLFSFGSLGIYIAFSGGFTLALILTFTFLSIFFQYRFTFRLNFSVLKEIGKFSIGNYIANIIGGLPGFLLPIIITNQLDPKFTAYYYMPMMMANFLYIIPQAITRSLFAEGSHDEKGLSIFLKKSLKINALFLLPSLIIFFFFGKYILLAFGSNYVEGGNIFLRYLAISSIFISINSVIGIIMSIKHKLKEIIVINVIVVGTMFGLVYVFIDRGLPGIGLAWLLGQALMSTIYIIYQIKFLRD